MPHASFVRLVVPLAGAALLLAMPASRAAAQTGKLTGIVTDSATGQPIEGVQLVLSRTGYGAMTGANGRYFVLAIPPGSYTVTARRIGYGSQQSSVQVAIDATRELSFKLSSSASTLAAVRIVENAAPLIQRGSPGTTQQVTAEELQNLPVRSVSEALQLQTGFSEIPSSSTDLTSFTSIRRNDTPPILIRGGRGGETGFLIDDVPVNNFLFGNQTMDVSVMAIAGSQTIKGFMAPQYGNALSGIVSVATREGGTTLDGALRYETSRLGGAMGSTPDDLRSYDFIEGFVSGPVPATNEKLRFVLSGRTQGAARQVVQFDNQLFNPFETDTFSRGAYQSDLIAGWRALGYTSQRDLFGKLTYYFTPSAKMSAGYIGYSAASQTVPFDWVLTGYSPARACVDAYKGRYNRSVDVEDACNTVYSADRLTPDGRPLGSERDAYIRPASPTRIRDLYTLRYEQTLGRFNYRVVGGFLNQRRETCAAFFSGVCLENRIADTNFNGRFVVSGVTSIALTPTEGTDRIAGDDRMRTKLARVDGQWQATDHHNVAIGAFFQGHDLAFYEANDVGLNNVQVLSSNYAAKPWDGAVYLQDKVEYDFLTVHLGARFEYARADGIFFNDPLDPTNGTTLGTVCDNPARFGLPGDYFRANDPKGNPVTGRAACGQSNALRDTANALAFRDDMGKAPIRTAFSPRIGFSIPVTERSDAYFNFGVYVQNPLYSNVYQNTGIGTPREGTLTAPTLAAGNLVGNPRLTAERTSSYELGYQSEFGQNWALTAVAYAKDQSALTGIRPGGILRGTETGISDPGSLYGSSRPRYTVLVNQDFQTVRGTEFTVRRKLANYWSGQLGYTYMQARTNASAPDLELQRTEEEGDVPARAELRSDIDLRHVLTGQFALTFNQRVPQFALSSLLRNTGLSSTMRLSSGFPYTPALNFSGNERLLRNSGSAPPVFVVNLEARKAWNVSNLRYSGFVRVSNLLDAKNCVQVFATTGNCDGGASPQARLAAGNATGEGELSTFFDRPHYYGDRRFINAGVRVDF